MRASCRNIRNNGCSLEDKVKKQDLSRLELARPRDEAEEDLLEFDGERESVEKHVDLEDAEEEEAEVLEHLGKKVPEEADVGGEVGNRQAAEDRRCSGGAETRRDMQR